MGPLGMGEIVVLFILALLIFGPKKLPELGKTFGKGMAEFKRASTELRSTFKKEMDNIERETKDEKSVTGDVSRDINKSYYYDDNEDDYYSDYDYAGTGSGSGAAAGETDGSDTVSKADGKASPASGSGSSATTDAGAAGQSPSPSGDESSQPVSGVPDAEDAPSSKQA